jgi:hypothetical protein
MPLNNIECASFCPIARIWAGFMTSIYVNLLANDMSPISQKPIAPEEFEITQGLIGILTLQGNELSVSMPRG